MAEFKFKIRNGFQELDYPGARFSLGTALNQLLILSFLDLVQVLVSV